MQIGKDRASKSMVMEAIKHDLIKQNPMDNYYHVFEGSSGSTGISLAHIIQSISTPKKQYKMHVVLPDDQSKEKKDILEKLNVDVCVVPTCSISNPNHYVNKARQLAIEYNGYFINQFENLHNYKVHYEETGPEIIRQVSNLNSKSSDSSTVSDNIHHNKIAKIDGFVMSAGTGGTIAGIAKCLKEHAKKHNQACIVALADPNGSSLGNKINHGVCYTTQQQESKIRKHRYDSIVEGVGLDRITNNFKQALDYIDIAYTVSDQEILNMAHYVLQHEGILIGSSSALNLCVVIKLAKEHFNSKKQSPNDDPPTIVSILCDQGYRHISRFWNRDYITRPPYSLKWPDSSMDFDM